MITSARTRLPRLVAGLVLALTAAGCGGGSSNGDSNGNGGGNGSGDVVNGAARIGWDQQAADATELATLRFVLYIDGTRTELPGASCSAPSGTAGFSCLSPLPTMTAGQHTIQLASYVVIDSVLESPKSAPLVITVAGSTGLTAGSVTLAADTPASVVPSPTASREVVTSEGTRLRVEIIATLEQSSALAPAGSGAFFVGDRSGVIRMVQQDVTSGRTVSASDISGGEARTILDVAVDPQFPRTHLVYVLDATRDGTPTFRLSRFREVDGRLGERAVLIDEVAASADRPSGALAFGPDGRLYVALDDGGDPDAAVPAASYNGKVLRLSADGTTPDDQEGSSPVYAANLLSPRSLTWDAVTSSLWIADAGTRRAARIRGSRRRATTTAYRLPDMEGAASLALYRGALIPTLQGSLLAAPLEDAPYLLRMRMADAEPTTILASERLAITGLGAVRLVKAGADGAIYVATDAAVLRLTPR